MCVRNHCGNFRSGILCSQQQLAFSHVGERPVCLYAPGSGRSIFAAAQWSGNGPRSILPIMLCNRHQSLSNAVLFAPICVVLSLVPNSVHRHQHRDVGIATFVAASFCNNTVDFWLAGLGFGWCLIRHPDAHSTSCKLETSAYESQINETKGPIMLRSTLVLSIPCFTAAHMHGQGWRGQHGGGTFIELVCTFFAMHCRKMPEVVVTHR